MLYASDGPDRMGIEGLGAGTYRLRWFDPVDGSTVDQTVAVGEGTASFPVPGGLGDEIALSLERQGGPAPTTTAPTTTVAPTTTAPTTTVAPTTTAPTTTAAPPTTAPPVPAPPSGALTPVAAAYLETGRGLNRADLRVENGGRERIVHLRFAVSGTDVTGGSLLTLTVADDPGAGTLTVHQGSSTGWSEGDLSATNAPQPGTELGSVSGTFVTGDEVVIDLVGVDAGGVLELVVTSDRGGSRDVSFHASETAAGPTLVATGTSGAGEEPPPEPTTPTTTPPEPTTTTVAPTPPGASLGESADGTSGVYAELPRGAERRRWADCDPFAAEEVWVCATFDIRTGAQLVGAHEAARGGSDGA